MNDLSWLSQEAHNFHQIFESVFYILITCFLLLGVLIEFFKVPIDGQVHVAILVGRAFVATILLHTFTDVMNLISEVMDGLTEVLGAQNNFDLIRARMADKWKSDFSWSWLQVSKSMTMFISWAAFAIFHLSYYIANAFVLFTWTTLYVFSPILIALFVLPQTSRATTALYRSLIEVGCWKPVWSVFATLLWSIGLSDINATADTSDVLTILSYTLVFAGALLMTPLMVHALAGVGLSGIMSSVGAAGLGPATVGVGKALGYLGRGSEAAKISYNLGRASLSKLSEGRSSKINRFAKALPKFHISKTPPLFEPKRRNTPKKSNSDSSPPDPKKK